MPATPPAPELVILEPPRPGFAGLGLSELWRHRHLVSYLGWRDTKLQFKQTMLGAAWAIVQPLALALIFSLVFGVLFKVKTEGVPYLLFFYTAMVPWALFTKCLTSSSQSVVSNAHLVQKVYFPRLVIPFASLIPGLVDFGFAFLVLLGMCLVYGRLPGAAILLMPALLLLTLVTALGLGLWLGALNVRYRDAAHLLPLISTLWFYATPVFYPIKMVPEKWRWFYGLNPMVGVTEGFRWLLFGSQGLSLGSLAASTIGALLLLLSGLFYFRRCERTFADEL